MLTKLIDKKEHKEWLKTFNEYTKKEIETCINKELNPDTEIMTMGEVIKVLNELTKGDAVIVSDVGQHQMVACRYAKFNQTRSNVTSVSYTHLRAHETGRNLVCRLLLE